MADDRDILARIERDERRLAGLLEATPAAPPATMDRVRQAVAVECERELIARFDDPTPDAVTVERVRQAVRAELRRGGFRTLSERTRRICAAVSAAACLVAAVGFVRFVVPIRVAGPGDSGGGRAPSLVVVAEESTEQLVEDMTVAFQSVWERRDASLSILTDEVARVAFGPSDLDPDGVEAELQAIGDEIRGLLSERSLPLET